MNNVELVRTLSWRENALFEERKKTFLLSQMNDVELVQTLSWRENALFEELEKKFKNRFYALVGQQVVSNVSVQCRL